MDNVFKEKLINDINQLLKVSQNSKTKIKKYESWINEVCNEKVENKELISFIFAKASFTDDKEYSDYLLSIPK